MKLSKLQQTEHADFLKKLGNRIVELRKLRKLSQADLAYQIGMETPNLRQIEKAKRNPTIKSLLLIAEGLEVSIQELIDF